MSAPSEDGETTNGSDDRPAAAQAAAEINAGSEVSRLRSRVSQLENELERKEAEVQTVRRQYEAILQGGEYDASTGGRAGDAGLLDRLR
jgi:molecular chaperone GrpE (heat shock protein)